MVYRVDEKMGKLGARGTTDDFIKFFWSKLWTSSLPCFVSRISWINETGHDSPGGISQYVGSQLSFKILLCRNHNCPQVSPSDRLAITLA